MGFGVFMLKKDATQNLANNSDAISSLQFHIGVQTVAKVIQYGFETRSVLNPY